MNSKSSYLSLALAALIFFVPAAQAQTPAAGGAIDGTISTQGGTVMLPGVLVLVRNAAGEQLTETVSDDQGRIAIPDVPPGEWRVSASLDGFDPAERTVTVSPGVHAAIAIDLGIATLSEHVEVVAAPTVSATTGTLAAAETVTNTQTQWLAPGGTVQSALRLLSSVVVTPAGDSINGGRPWEAGYQIGAASLVDPTTNVARVWLPADGIDSVGVLANPYEVEFGRFSSGLVVVQTRRAADRWKLAVNNTIPAFRTKRSTIANIEGIGAVKPSLEAGGPLVKGRVFLEQTAQFHWDQTDVPSRPENELKTTQWYGALTRVDANVSAHHTLVFSGGFDQADATQATLGTFTPPPATVNVSDDVGYVMATERTLVGASTFVETMVQLHQYGTGVHGQGTTPMELLPDTTAGDFFNRQHRDSTTVQWVETASTSHRGPGGQHLIKFGADVMASDYDGTSASTPIRIARADGTLARLLDYTAPTTQQVHSVDVALFAQDRLQPSKRWYLEYGGRVDRDGVLGDYSVSPRVGVAVLLNAAATAVLRGGYGIFYERTPSIAGAFTAFETAVDSRYAADGVTVIGAPLPMTHVVADLRAARSETWDIAYDHRLSPRWALHFGVLDRNGDHELVLDPERSATEEQLVLSSEGRSHYLQEEVSVHLTRGTRMDVSASYVHATTRENLNAFVNFYAPVLTPVVGADAYAPGAADAPNRLFVRGQAMPTSRWMLVGVFDWRNGLPYSIVNENLEYVGARNELRFPAYVRTELGLDRRITIGRAHPWLGIRAANALAAFLPVDVQANLNSPAFGTFYNSEYRQFRVHIKFER